MSDVCIERITVNLLITTTSTLHKDGKTLTSNRKTNYKLRAKDSDDVISFHEDDVSK